MNMLFLIGLLFFCMHGCQPNKEIVALQNQVKVFSKLDHYVHNENIEMNFTIRNMSDFDIVTQNMKSYCSILKLQMKIQDSWESVLNCQSRAPTRFILIETGAELEVKLSYEMPSGIITPGTYRAILEFVVGQSYDQSELLHSFSEEFVISD